MSSSGCNPGKRRPTSHRGHEGAESHYEDFLGLMGESLDFVPMRVLAYCLMPNHWHMVLYPRADGELSRFLQRITLTHTQRHHAHPFSLPLRYYK